MNISRPNRHMLYYIATPYTRYKHGLEKAYAEASHLAVRLQDRGWRVFSPIAAFHPLARTTGIDPCDHKFWLTCCMPWIEKCDALVIAAMEGWMESVGITWERKMFSAMNKPIQIIDQLTLKPLEDPTP